MSAIQSIIDYVYGEAENLTMQTMVKDADQEFINLRKELQTAQELAELRKQQIDEMNRSYEITMREGCGDTGHCTCVPALRHRIEELEETLKEAE